MLGGVSLAENRLSERGCDILVLMMVLRRIEFVEVPRYAITEGYNNIREAEDLLIYLELCYLCYR